MVKAISKTTEEYVNGTISMETFSKKMIKHLDNEEKRIENIYRAASRKNHAEKVASNRK